MANKTTAPSQLEFGALSAQERHERVWNNLISSSSIATGEEEGRRKAREWPTYGQLMQDMAQADYQQTLTCPLDLLPSNTKTLCPHGVVCSARMELFPFPRESINGGDMMAYTGLLAPGQTVEHGILRLASAMKPPQQEITSSLGRVMLYSSGQKLRQAKLFPTAALKIFRNGISGGIDDAGSGNLLFGGSKVGQSNSDFFAHCQCTTLTERIPRTVKPLLSKFWKYSDYPLSLGVSHFCRYDVFGQEVPVDQLHFPFAIILRPLIRLNEDEGACSESSGSRSFASRSGSKSTSSDSLGDRKDSGEDPFDSFVNKTLGLPIGTALFDIFACPDPCDVLYASKLQRIGRITTTSNFLVSTPGDGLFFQHQRKEDDYELSPGWQEALKTQVCIDEGKTKGTVGMLAGWELFEQQIARESYVDFEKHAA